MAADGVRFQMCGTNLAVLHPVNEMYAELMSVRQLLE